MEQKGNTASQPDPLVGAIATYREGARRLNELEDDGDAYTAATAATHTSYDILCAWHRPVTREGALAALRFIRDGDMIEESAGHTMLSAAINYLECSA